MKLLQKSNETYLNDNPVNELAIFLSNITVEDVDKRGSRALKSPFMVKLWSPKLMQKHCGVEVIKKLLRSNRSVEVIKKKKL